MKPIDASKKAKENVVQTNLRDHRQKRKPIFHLGHIIHPADIKKVFSIGGSTNWSFKLYTITELIHDTIPGYRIDYLPERYNQNLLLPTKLTLEENNQVMKELMLIQ